MFDFITIEKMSPSFYQIGGAMLPPEAISNRKAAANGEALVFTTKNSMVEHLVELEARRGKNVSSSQKRRYDAMRRDQLEVLISNASKAAPVSKSAAVAPADALAKKEKAVSATDPDPVSKPKKK